MSKRDQENMKIEKRLRKYKNRIKYENTIAKKMMQQLNKLSTFSFLNVFPKY